MYLYTARFSRRHCDSERGTGVRKNPNTRVFAVVLSHSRMFEPRRAAGLFEWKGSQPQSALSKMYSASQKSNSVKGYKPKKPSDSTLFWLSEIDGNEQIPLHVTAACEMGRAEASTRGEKRKDRWRRQSLAAGPGAVTELDRWRVWKQGRGRRVLTAGQAAHFTVLSAGLVHEGTVEAGPHGGGGGRNRGAAHGPVIQRAGGLPTHCTWKDSRGKTGYYHSEE